MHAFQPFFFSFSLSEINKIRRFLMKNNRFYNGSNGFELNALRVLFLMWLFKA